LAQHQILKLRQRGDGLVDKLGRTRRHRRRPPLRIAADRHHSGSAGACPRKIADQVATDFGLRIAMQVKVSGESFITPPGALSDLVGRAVKAETGRDPVLSTSGGTSDARFVQHHCPVVEFGLVGKTMHQVDERVAVDQIVQLKAIYGRILADYFA
jgi:succinyl-diaminopimelate desuccinylase